MVFLVSCPLEANIQVTWILISSTSIKDHITPFLTQDWFAATSEKNWYWALIKIHALYLSSATYKLCGLGHIPIPLSLHLLICKHGSKELLHRLVVGIKTDDPCESSWYRAWHLAATNDSEHPICLLLYTKMTEIDQTKPKQTLQKYPSGRKETNNENLK